MKTDFRDYLVDIRHEDRLIHGYDVVYNEILWVAVNDTIPGILEKIHQLINE